MTVPDFESLMLPILKFAEDQQEHSIYEAEEYLSKSFDLTDDERNQLLPSGRQRIFPNRISWARLYLKKAGLLVNPQRGYFRITEQGLQVLQQNPESIDSKFLAKFSKSDFGSGTQDDQSLNALDAKTKSPEDLMELGYKQIQTNLEQELLDTIKEKPPRFFENLITQLVEKMGYGSGRAVGRSGDGGVDGIIKSDELGLSEIYLQAKRWEENVQEPAIRNFAGSLESKKSKKGIFITTSNFSAGARKFIETIPSKIVLINGIQLAQLMIKHNIGVKPVNSYETKRIDYDYFSDN